MNTFPDKEKIYSDTGQCPKCGGKDINTRFCPGGRASILHSDNTAWGGHCCPLGEHLHRNCTDCNYIWLKYCFDDEKRSGVKELSSGNN